MIDRNGAQLPLRKMLGEAAGFREGRWEAIDLVVNRLRPREGRALSVWGDAVWGARVAKGKYRAGRFDGALVEASVRLIRERSRPEPPPRWLTAVPSGARPELVRDFAAELAERLGFPFLSAIVGRRPTAPQKVMRNSVMQLRNLLGAFATAGTIPAGPVLLVDPRAQRLGSPKGPRRGEFIGGPSNSRVRRFYRPPPALQVTFLGWR